MIKEKSEHKKINPATGFDEVECPDTLMSTWRYCPYCGENIEDCDHKKTVNYTIEDMIEPQKLDDLEDWMEDKFNEFDEVVLTSAWQGTSWEEPAELMDIITQDVRELEEQLKSKIEEIRDERKN